MLPRSSQLDAKIGQESPTYSQDRPREPNLWPRSPKILPKSLQLDPPRPQNVAKTMWCCSILHFGHFSKDRSQDHQKCSKKLPKWPQDGHLGPNLASRWPSWPLLGGSWRHLGSNLVPSWPNLARFWPIRARPKLTKICQDSF